MRSIVKDIAIGIAWFVGIEAVIVLLVAAITASLGPAAPFIIGIFLYRLPGDVNFFFVLAFLAIFIYGAKKKRPGIQWAPLVLFGVWFVASVGNRAFIWATADRALWAEPEVSGLASNRTVVNLTETGPSNLIWVLLANGYIDRYVFVRAFDTKHASQELASLRLASGSACDAEARENSDLLARAGRFDECFIAEAVATVPDGLVLRLDGLGPRATVRRGDFILRRDGVETVAAQWLAHTYHVLSYFPLLTPMGSSPYQEDHLWHLAPRGIFQRVAVGQFFVGASDMLKAIYGVTDKEPIRVAEMDDASLKARLATLLAGADHPRWSVAMVIVLRLQQHGALDDECLHAAASLIGRGGVEPGDVAKFFKQATDQQRQRFLNFLLDRVEASSARDEFQARPYGSFPRSDISPAISERAERIFMDRRDLGIGQYRQALELARVSGVRPHSPEWAAEQAHFFASLVDDDASSFVERAIAFKEAFPQPTDDERKVFAEKLSLVPDDRLEKYLRLVGWHEDWVTKLPSPATVQLRSLAADRIELVVDGDLRARLRREFPAPPAPGSETQ